MSTYTDSLGLEEITPGSQAGLWGDTTNNNLVLIDQAVTGVTPISFAAASGTTVTLDGAVGTVNTARSAVLNITGLATGSNTVVIPNRQKTYLVRNDSGQNVVFQTASPGATYTVEAGYSILIFCDGNNGVYTGIQSANTGPTTVNGGGTGATTFTAGFIKSPGGTANLTSSTYVALASDVSGTLPVLNGGTGVGGFTSGALVVGNGTSPLAVIAGSAAGQVLTYNGSSWQPRASGLTPGSYTNTNIVVNADGIVTAISTGSGSSGVTSVTAASPLSSTGGTTPQISISNSPSFATSVTAPTYYVGNTNNYITQSSNEISFVVAGSTTGGKFTANGLGTTNVVASGAVAAGNVFYGNYNLSVKGQPFQSAAYVENGSAGQCIAVLGVGGGTINALSFYYGSVATTVGNITMTAGGTGYNTSSDRRLKSNIVDLKDVGATIDALQPRTYTWNATGESAKGFIADELQQVIPSAVTGEPNAVDKDGKPEYQMLDASTPEMIALMVAELQSLRKRVAELEAKAS
jgi:hypothetical protein